jgi:hypothetical protein
MGVSGQRHSPAALYPRGKDPRYPFVQEAGWAPEPVWTQRIDEKSFAPARDRTPYLPVVQPVVRHYTAWANPAPLEQGTYENIRTYRGEVTRAKKFYNG